MKTLFYTKTLIALAVAVAAAAAAVSQAQEQPIPPPSVAGALPPDIMPGTPLAEVVKMVQAGVDVGTIRSYVFNSQSAFNLDADKIIYLKDLGVPSDLVNAMMDRDKVLYASTIAPQPAQATVVTSAPDITPPAELTVNYFYDSLAPYGSWVAIEGYGRCWRPTVVAYDSGWRPYGDRGHWVYTDCGWYWDSDYSWGATFHYGRWFHHGRFGWCWYPDTVWAPSWVTWRSGGEYCGWAPLPPFAVFTPGVGFFYRGVSVALDFDFGLGADCFMFVSPSHFCERHPRSFFVESTRVNQFFRQTTIINNYNVNRTTIVNHGIPVDHISSVTHHQIEPIHVGSLPNAGKQGWRGEGFDRSVKHGSMGNNNNPGGSFSSGNNQLRHGPELRNDLNNTANANQHGTLGQTTQGSKQVGNKIEPLHSTTQQNVQGQANNNNQSIYQLQKKEPLTTGNNHFQQSQQPVTTVNPAVSDHRVTQYNWQSGQSSQGQPKSTSSGSQSFQSGQTHSFDQSALSGSQQHGASQLQQQHPFVAPIQPKVESRVESVPRSYSPPPSPPATSQGQSHSSSGGSSSGSNSSSDRGSDRGKQNR